MASLPTRDQPPGLLALPNPARPSRLEPPPASPSLPQRIASASLGAILTCLFTTPLDVAKTRLQAAVPQGAPRFTSGAAACRFYAACKNADPSFLAAACAHVERGLARGSEPGFGRNWRVLQSAGSQAVAAASESVSSAAAAVAAAPPGVGGACKEHQHAPLRRPSTLATLGRIARQEGIRGLWSGLTPALVMAVPSTVVYFTAYDELKRVLEGEGASGGPPSAVTPLVAGIVGRTLTATVVSPLELLRTRAMYAPEAGSGARPGLLRTASRLVAADGFTSLWRGLSATLWRDVPFSGLYWFGYETLRARFTALAAASSSSSSSSSLASTYGVSFASGMLAGGIAAFVTTPFDVIKTRRQLWQSHAGGSSSASPSSAATSVYSPAHPTSAVLRFVVREEGVRGLYAGVGARLAKVAPSCAIMIATYEAGKALFSSGVDAVGGVERIEDTGSDVE